VATSAQQVDRRLVPAQPRMLVGGDWVGARSGATATDLDPSTGAELCELPAGDAADVDDAVRAARDAAAGWAATTPDRRSQALWRLAQLVEEHAEELAQLDALEGGKPIATARRIDLPAAAQMLRYWAGWPTKIEGSTMPLSVPGAWHAFTRREPLGVAGVILPWNAPALFVAWKVGAALACANAVVLKPAAETPLSALRIGELALTAGLAPGVLNVVTGGAAAGAALAAHDGVDRIAFTGSVQTGRRVAQAALGDLKRVSLELGGKSPNVVCADADLAAAVPGAANACFFNQGCVCAAGSRLFVHESVFDEVLAGVCAAAERLRVGPAAEPSTRIGPLVSAPHRERVAALVDRGLDAGARAAIGGEPAQGPGFFYPPTVLVDVDPQLPVAREEVFGPVVVAAPFRELGEVVERCNDTAYGLAAGVWTRDLRTAHELVGAIRAGTVWVNAYNVVDPSLPFGGMGQSGWGRDLGREAVELFTETKAVCMRTG
jgi:phenylacetaldehyde dehydrogenase